MLATLLSTKTVKKYIAVEASPTAARVLQETIKEFDAKIVSQVNGAISYSAEAFADFSETSFTGSRLSSLSKGTGPETSHLCPIFTLSEIIEKEIYPKTEYVLLTDIEGAEADIFVNDQAALKYCKKIICELDETEQYSVADQQAAIEKCGFKLAEFYGNVFVYCNEELAS